MRELIYSRSLKQSFEVREWWDGDGRDNREPNGGQKPFRIFLMKGQFLDVTLEN